MRLLLAVLSLAFARSEIVIENVNRKIDGSNAKVTFMEEIDFKNTGSEAEGSMELCTRKPSVGSLAFYRVVEGAYKRGAKPLVTESVKGFKFDDVICAKVVMPAPIEPGATVKITTYGAFIRALTNFPENVTQDGMPKVVLHADALLTTPYKVAKQTTTVKLATSNVESYGADDASLSASHSGSSVTYGPFADTLPFTYKPITIHYDFPKPVIRVSKLVREVTVSPWGNIYIDEEYDMTNAGPQLIGQFSRLRHMMSLARASPQMAMMGGNVPDAARAAIDSVTARLPKDARWAYYRDDIGNISTSNTKLKTAEVEISLSPRFPLYGGWRSVFKFGYSLPFKGYLTRGAKDTQRLRLQFASPIADALVDSYELHVVLPEGAVPLVDTGAGPHGSSVSLSSKTTYFDLSGRPVVVYTMDDVVGDHNTWFHIDYKYPGIRMMQAPATIVVAVLVVLTATALLSRASSLSISSGDERHKARVRAEKAAALRSEFVGVMRGALRGLDGVEADLRLLAEKASDALPAVKARRAAHDKARSKFDAAAKELIARAAAVDGGVKEELERFTRQTKGLIQGPMDALRALVEDGKSDFVKVGKALVDADKERKRLLEDAEAVLGEDAMEM